MRSIGEMRVASNIGDCLEVMKRMDDNKFMEKRWDNIYAINPYNSI